MSYSRIWTDYDKDSDVLYIKLQITRSCRWIQKFIDDDVIVRYEKGDIIGIHYNEC
jgi:uncharacterized protein YuzE